MKFLKKHKTIIYVCLILILWISSSAIAGERVLDNSNYMSQEYNDMEPGLGILIGNSAFFIIPLLTSASLLLIGVYLLLYKVVRSEKTPLLITIILYFSLLFYAFNEIVNAYHQIQHFYLFKLYWSIIACISYSLFVIYSVYELGLILIRRFKFYHGGR